MASVIMLLTGTGWATFSEFIDQLAPRVSGIALRAPRSRTLPHRPGERRLSSSKAGTLRAGGSALYLGSTETLSIGSGTAITPDQDRLYPWNR